MHVCLALFSMVVKLGLLTHAKNRRLNTFNLRNLRRILGITWQDHVTNKDVLEQAGKLSVYALLTKRRLRWLRHVSRMEYGRIPKDVLYCELVTGTRPAGRPLLRFKDVCKRDLRSGDIDPADWEVLAADRTKWRQAINIGLQTAEQRREKRWEERRERRRLRL